MALESQATSQAVLVSQAALNEEQAYERLALFDDDGTPVTSLAAIGTGVLTGYVAGTDDDVAATDSINEAIAKVEAKAQVGYAVSVTTGTAIGTAAKTTTSDEPADNTIVAVKFTNGNSAETPSLAFNGGTARAMKLGGTASAAAKLTVAANGVVLFFFDGTVLHQLGTVS